MADKKTDAEPSIEEILASIRQIITDDDEKPASAAPAPAPVKPAPASNQSSVDDIFDLTADMQAMSVKAEPVPPPPAPAPVSEPEPVIDLDFDTPSTPEPEAPRAPVMMEPDMTDILSEHTRRSTTAAMAKLAGNMPIQRHRGGVSSVTLEDMVRDMLHPMLRDWMDTNLSPMVERLVQKELEKLARKAMDE